MQPATCMCAESRSRCRKELSSPVRRSGLATGLILTRAGVTMLTQIGSRSCEPRRLPKRPAESSLPGAEMSGGPTAGWQHRTGTGRIVRLAHPAATVATSEETLPHRSASHWPRARQLTPQAHGRTQGGPRLEAQFHAAQDALSTCDHCYNDAGCSGVGVRLLRRHVAVRAVGP